MKLSPLRTGLAVFAPLLLSVALRVALVRAGAPGLAVAAGALGVFLVATWACVWRLIGVSRGRAMLYALAVVGVNVLALAAMTLLLE